MTSKGVSSGPSTREVYKSGPPPSPLYISQLRDTDDDDNVSSHEGDVDGSEDPVSYGPLEKRRRISPPDGGDVHLVSHDLVDHAGEPLFDPSFMVHPNSKEWYPSEHVADYVSFFLRHPLDKAARNKLKSECPRPSLPDNITATPVIDPNMLMFFSKFGKDPKKGVDRAWSGCQDKLLDLVGPLTRIFDLAEEAKMDSNPIDPERAVIIRERASFFLSFRHSVSQRPSSAVEDARSSAAHSFQRTRSIPHILWAGIPCQLILASRLYFRPGLLAI
ncbi:hypothetical protein NDU88_004771 [Pleurodeles waltl]|uniref:Uncharacterized protein n=1 Tax=Pleurodeles waltl TaxID=8319 RepID=A0AAV7L2D2_PLEWA|nr:hypothetical protein NDU88_004771 [Pleurodeles waltl]